MNQIRSRFIQLAHNKLHTLLSASEPAVISGHFQTGARGGGGFRNEGEEEEDGAQLLSLTSLCGPSGGGSPYSSGGSLSLGR